MIYLLMMEEGLEVLETSPCQTHWNLQNPLQVSSEGSLSQLLQWTQDPAL